MLVFMEIVCGSAWIVITSTTNRILDASDTMREIADGDGDLSRSLSTSGADEISQLGESFNTFSQKISQIIHNVVDISHQLDSSSTEVMTLSSKTQQDVSSQQSHTKATVASIEQMSISVNEVSSTADSAASTAEQIEDNVQAGKSQVLKTISTINKLATEMQNSSQVAEKLQQDSIQIGSVIDVIKGIAEQTNLLALNAAIEAARAGEQGRGFAVVADEVRTLASRTQQSTAEIQSIIEDLQSNTNHVVSVIGTGQELGLESTEQSKKAEESLQVIAESVNTIKGLNSQIAQSVKEQLDVSKGITENIEQINSIGESSSDSANSSVSHSRSMNELADNLRVLVDRFKL